jgi:hypothetical protein
MAFLSRYKNKVDHRRNSSQKHRWVAIALLEIEPGLCRVKRYKKLWKLRDALRGNANLVGEAA